MSMSDNIADSLTRIRNAQSVRLLQTQLMDSGVIRGILSVMKEEGYVKDFRVESAGKSKSYITVDLKYSPDGSCAISELVRVSKPGKRVYSKASDLRPCYNGMGIYILSTPKGVISDRSARKLSVGGEIMCKIF